MEKWESYPFPNAAVPFLVLVPDSATPQRPAPVLFCIPGSDQTKEELAAETSAELENASLPRPGPNAMAWHYVREGWVAVVVDNAGAGEQGDAERAAGRASHDYDNLARLLLEMDWSWLGYTSYTDQCILNWVKKLPFIQKNHIILSGFSLGTEPMMVLGVLNPDIYAFVYNDFLCRTLERAQTMTKPSANGSRPAPNSIRHLIPGFWQQFDFPDIVASLAPRPVICTEGGLDRDFGLIAQAYRMAGREDAFRFLHQPRFADPAKRWQGERLPSGLDRTEFFRLANVDPRNHFFKKDAVIPWIKSLLDAEQTAERPADSQQPRAAAESPGHPLKNPAVQIKNLPGGGRQHLLQKQEKRRRLLRRIEPAQNVPGQSRLLHALAQSLRHIRKQEPRQNQIHTDSLLPPLPGQTLDKAFQS